MRSMNKYDLDLVRRLVEKNPQLSSWRNSLIGVEDIGKEDADWYHIQLFYSDKEWDNGGYSVLADWCAVDSDGAVLEMLVLGDASDGRPIEIEIQRLDSQPIISLPPAERWVDIER